jgi:hypothetical protein
VGLSLTNPHDTAYVAQTYVERGWAVIPIRADAKLPIELDWPNKGRRTAAEVAAAWTLYPDANVGILTGVVSGLWVLDIDPGNGGMVALSGLVAAYGRLPETYVVRTPSGGLHYYFLLPADFEPRNAQHGRRAGRLPVGIDVRGRGGQVVAPPSTRVDGRYVLEQDFPLSPAPEWLLDMLRPVEQPAAPPVAASAAAIISAAAVNHLWDGWVRKVFTEELARLAGAQQGARDEIAFSVAVRLVEICNSDWNVVELDDAYPLFMQAAAIASANGDQPFTQVEAGQKWRNAIGRRAGLGIPPPAPLGISGTPMPWVPPSDFDQAGQDPANPFVSPGVPGTSMHVAGELINGPTGQPGSAVVAWSAPDPFDEAVRIEMGKLLVRREAAKRLADMDRRPTDFGLELVTGSALDDLPGAVVLVDGYLDMDSLARVNGPSGHGKSFVTLDFACSVATGRAWHGSAVTQAESWYVVGEGARGMRRRERAWCQRHGLDSGESGVIFLPRAIQVDGPEWVSFVEHAAMRRPGLIVFDTQARMTVGVKENDATEMGVIVDALDRLRQASGACVLLVHHRGLAGEHGRGSTAIKGALDTELDVSKVGTTITVKVMKRKDDVERAPLQLTMNPLGDSVVLVADADMASAVPGSPFTSPSVQLTGQEKAGMAIAQALMAAAGSGLTRSEAQVHARVQMCLPSTDTVKKMIRRAWSDLVGLGRISKADGREAYFFIDLEGATILDINPDKLVEGGPERYVPV